MRFFLVDFWALVAEVLEIWFQIWMQQYKVGLCDFLYRCFPNLFSICNCQIFDLPKLNSYFQNFKPLTSYLKSRSTISTLRDKMSIFYSPYVFTLMSSTENRIIFICTVGVSINWLHWGRFWGKVLSDGPLVQVSGPRLKSRKVSVCCWSQTMDHKPVRYRALP